MTTFTPAQQTLYNALMRADRSNVVVMKKALDAWKADPTSDPRAGDFGAPVGTPAWDHIGTAVDAFEEALNSRDDTASVHAAIPVVDAVLAAKS